MKKNLLKSSLALLALGCAASSLANPRAAMMIAADGVEAIDNFQEYAAAHYFAQKNPDGVIIAPGETSKISAENLDCIWIHIDRVGVGIGNLPTEFSDEATLAALKQFVADGGSLLLTKQATQLVTRIDRMDSRFAPGIYGDGDGGKGSDIWTVNACIGYWMAGWPESDHYDLSQYYDHMEHPIYADLDVIPAHGNDRANFETPTFPMEGAPEGEEMWREDHNCMWDLNAYSYTADGKNTVEKFENENNATVLGTWGHVIDYAVAGIIEFKPQADGQGTILANGLAACEWSPREGVNAFHANLEKLTDNCLGYLLAKSSAVESVAVDAALSEAPAEYYNLQGMKVSSSDLTPGIYVVRQGEKTSKTVIR